MVLTCKSLGGNCVKCSTSIATEGEVVVTAVEGAILVGNRTAAAQLVL